MKDFIYAVVVTSFLVHCLILLGLVIGVIGG